MSREAEIYCPKCSWRPSENWYHYPDGQNESTDDAKVEHEELETT